MATNGFEDSRIAEGTLHTGANHVVNPPAKTDPALHYTDGHYVVGQEVLNGHQLRTPVRRVPGASTLTGASVRNPAGESLGKIEDIMIDLERGRIAYAVLSFGGLFGIGNKFFILPWSALTLNQKTNEFILDVQREVLEKGPGFERDNWPDLADPAYGRDIHRHYGRTPYWEDTSVSARRGSHVTDFSSDEFNRCCE